MRINLIDPALHKRGGHHFEWLQRIAQGLADRGTPAHLYCRARPQPEVLQAFSRTGGATPLFDVPTYERVDSDVEGADLSACLTRADMLARSLPQVRPADLWIMPTLFAQDLHALAAAPPRATVVGVVHWPPEFGLREGGRGAWRSGVQRVARVGLDLRLGTIVGGLCEIYEPLLGRPVSLLPSPLDARVPQAPKQALRRIGFFGEQRGAKGADLIPQLVPELLKKGYVPVVHDSAGRMLRGSPPPGIELHGYVDDIRALVASCDLVVLPYSAQQYRVMSSGLLWEALASGVPAVVAAGTAPASTLLESGAGRTFAEPAVTDILAAIQRVQHDYPAVAHAAWTASSAWALRHGVDAFLRALMRLPKVVTKAG